MSLLLYITLQALIESLKKVPKYSVYVYGALEEIFSQMNAWMLI